VSPRQRATVALRCAEDLEAAAIWAPVDDEIAARLTGPSRLRGSRPEFRGRARYEEGPGFTGSAGWVNHRSRRDEGAGRRHGKLRIQVRQGSLAKEEARKQKPSRVTLCGVTSPRPAKAEPRPELSVARDPETETRSVHREHAGRVLSPEKKLVEEADVL